ncbi:UNVERIFIED_CONTAM: hypothetical protein Sindi_1866100 [Sesamum indicum]
MKDGHDEGVRRGWPECALDLRRALRAHAEHRNAEAERGCSLPSRDALASSKIVGETHGGRLASRGRPRRDAKACVPRASTNMGILDRRAQGHAVLRRDAFRCRAKSQKSVELTEARLAPNWKVSDHSTILNSEAGQESYEIYRHTNLPHDQAALLSCPYPQLEQYGAHALAQAGSFMRSLSLKCTVLRKRRQEAQEKYREIRSNFRAKEKEWGEERRRLDEVKTGLEVEVAWLKAIVESHGAEVARAREEGSGFSAGQEAGLIQGRTKGREEFLNSAKFDARVRSARLEGARDFLKTPVFDTAVEIKASIYMTQGFNKCKAQANKLGVFAEGFDQNQLNPFVDENFQPYPVEPSPQIEGTEFASLMDEVEAMDE